MFTSFFSASIWKSGFRPFFLCAAIYGPLILLTWIGGYTGALHLLPIEKLTVGWHQHEMIFGFALAIMIGVLLTAIPSWTNSEEISGWKLALLAFAWLLGRLAIWFPEALTPQLVLFCDQLLIILVTLMVSRTVLTSTNKWYLCVFPISAGLFVGNVFFHQASTNNNFELQQTGITLALYSVIIFYAVLGGVFTRIFTGNELRKTEGKEPPVQLPLEIIAIASIVILAILDLSNTSSLTIGIAASFAAITNGLRLLSWRPYRSNHCPLVWVLQIALTWVALCFVLRAFTEFGIINGSSAWIHAFTIGALGTKQVGLMTRVVLRHTGRSLKAHPLMVMCFLMMSLAACIRIATTTHSLGNTALLISAILWATPFIIYLSLYGYMLVTPAQPKNN